MLLKDNILRKVAEQLLGILKNSECCKKDGESYIFRAIDGHVFWTLWLEELPPLSIWVSHTLTSFLVVKLLSSSPLCQGCLKPIIWQIVLSKSWPRCNIIQSNLFRPYS